MRALQRWPLGLTITGSPGGATAFVGGQLYVRIDSGDGADRVLPRLRPEEREGGIMRLTSPDDEDETARAERVARWRAERRVARW